MEGHRLTKPEKCSDELFELMNKCWLKQADDRPNFKEIRVELVKMLGDAGGQLFDSSLITSSGASCSENEYAYGITEIEE